MTEAPIMTLDEIADLAFRALVTAGTSEANARPLARATAETEADGIASHGLAYIPIYCVHVRCGKVDGRAVPELSRPTPSLVAVDAASGFAHPEIDRGFEALIPSAQEQGVAALAVRNSYN
jgi:(2R)-3-sulfolactate dehydrogenase (NADP+)